MKRISFEERKKIQLNMLIEIDKFCREHNIKYMLAFGTLLGAIRHKGYIPWDDDVDISMSYEDMLRFKKVLQSEHLQYCDVDTEKYYEWPFSRIAYKPTYMKTGMICRSYGVNIDLYPILAISSNADTHEQIVNELMPAYKKYVRILKLRRKVIKLLPVCTIPLFAKWVKLYRDRLVHAFTMKNGGAYYCICGPLAQYKYHIYKDNPMQEMIEVDFEGYKFMAPAQYHNYLSHHYGDYMQLPPEDQRHPYHGGKYYWK